MLGHRLRRWPNIKTTLEPRIHQCSLCIIWNIIFYYKLERKCIANACQFVIIYYKLGRSCSANAFQFVIIYYKLERNCITYTFQFVIIYYKLERYYKLGRNTALQPCVRHWLVLVSLFGIHIGFLGELIRRPVASTEAASRSLYMRLDNVSK